MLLSRKTTIHVTESQANIIGHMCYAAYKLWNVCNYERHHYKELKLQVSYPDWYYQKKYHKDDIWYKQLPSQTAQEICKQLDKAWKSFYALVSSGGIENPRPPRFKREGIAITYMQNGIVHKEGSELIRLTLPARLRKYMASQYGVRDRFLYLKNSFLRNTDNIKQLKIYPPSEGNCEVLVVYEVPDVSPLPDNGRYLGIDLGLHNLMTCYDSYTGETFITGRRYLSVCRRYDKEISRVQSQWAAAQVSKGIRYPRPSKHLLRLYKDKKHAVNDYLHKVTRAVTAYCKGHHINTVVIGDITGIREDKDLGHVTNQKLHSLPYKKIYIMLGYKLAMEGINMVMQKEGYSSQTSPLAPLVSRAYASKANRVFRGLYKDGDYEWNADCVGAFNIVRLYLQKKDPAIRLDPSKIKIPYILKVAA